MSADYFTEIESHFEKRRGTPFILNPKDWALMQKWRADGIPLPIVIEALDSVFDKQAERGKTVNSLHYCRHAVKELWAERKELQVGAASATPEEAPGALLELLAGRLKASGSAIIRAYAAKVSALAAEKSVPRIEERLMELEEQLMSELLASGPEVDALRSEAEAIDVSRLDEKTRARTIEANLRRLLRDRFALPRLTLF